jgi:hypothetical protein
VNDSSAIFERDTRLVPQVATLEGFVEGVSDVRGIDLRQLEPLTTLRVQTLNSLYRIVMTCGTSAIVQGGKFFLDPTPARIDGSGFGGSLLKVGWIGVGLNMEIFTNDQRIVTSPVRDVVIERPSSQLLH